MSLRLLPVAELLMRYVPTAQFGHGAMG